MVWQRLSPLILIFNNGADWCLGVVYMYVSTGFLIKCSKNQLLISTVGDFQSLYMLLSELLAEEMFGARDGAVTSMSYHIVVVVLEANRWW